MFILISPRWLTHNSARSRHARVHKSEIPFVFDNADRCAHLTGGTGEARSMAARVSTAWIEFARTGNPIFDKRCEVLYDHDRDARELFC